ncbi:MAG TPA: Nif3-like dinuclear metal center hexameric protein [Gemmatimonadaceae bacterium]|nr:Nif3-like dinuclear metal center hexameric protein [Gemmatimonadaceae bacterium]
MSPKPLSQIVEFLDGILLTSTTPDYPTAFNGLQLSNKGAVSKVAAAVDFSAQAIKAAIAEEADLLIVHHGMFWAGVQPLVGRHYTNLRDLLDADLAVYSSHLPLDRHPQLGNNVLMAKAFGLEPSEEFGRFKDIFIGLQGVSDTPTSALIERAQLFSRASGGEAIATSGTGGEHRTRRWAICTGSGASAETLAEAAQHDIDTLIVGEGPHWTAVEARERGITIIYLGHYASETLGVQALAAEVGRRFDLTWTNIAAPTGL